MELIINILTYGAIVSVYILGFLAVTAGFLFCIYALVHRILLTIKQRRWVEEKQIILGNIAEMKRWCGYEFPEVEKACDHLARGIERKIYMNMDMFREGLRRDKKVGRE